MIVRIKQFLRGLLGRINEEDKRFIDNYLDDYEKNLFDKMTRYEKLHTLAVSKKINRLYNNERLTKAGLLHDIGKIECAVNIVEKSIIVICDKFFRDTMKEMKLKKLKVHYNHGEIGYSLLKKREDRYSEEFLSIIRYHHDKSFRGLNQEEVKMLREVDEET